MRLSDQHRPQPGRLDARHDAVTRREYQARVIRDVADEPQQRALASAFDVGQAFGDPAVADPDEIHTAHVPVAPVVAPAHDGAAGPGGELLLYPEPGPRRPGEHVRPDLAHRVPPLVASAVRWRRG